MIFYFKKQNKFLKTKLNYYKIFGLFFKMKIKIIKIWLTNVKKSNKMTLFCNKTLKQYTKWKYAFISI
jgi:hypothetical protein